MTNREPRLSRDQLLEAMDVNWGRYLATVNTLPDDERLAYARALGYDSLEDLLAFLCAQFAAALSLVPTLIQFPGAKAVPAYTGAAWERRNQTLAQLEQDFEQLWTGVAGMMGEIPEDAYDNPEVYDRLYQTAVALYQEVEPPGDPQVPAEQHSRVRTEPGDHVPPDEDTPPGAAYESGPGRPPTREP